MKILIVVAMTTHRVIGSDRGLPWEIPEEYQHYLSLVKGHPVIMGRRSFEIFGSDLTDSETIVISRTSKPEYPIHATSLEKGLQIARRYNQDIFVAGGASIYRESIDLADQIHLSEIMGNYEGNVYFPAFSESAWKLTHTEDHERFIYRIYERNE